jgi:hypothetical protein
MAGPAGEPLLHFLLSFPLERCLMLCFLLGVEPRKQALRGAAHAQVPASLLYAWLQCSHPQVPLRPVQSLTGPGCFGVLHGGMVRSCALWARPCNAEESSILTACMLL